MSDPILLLPGFDGTGKLFADFVASIDEPKRASAASYRDEEVFDDYVQTVAGLLPSEPSVLIAESFSGPIAIALMQRYPRRIKKAVLCATFLRSPFRLVTQFAHFLPTRMLGASIVTKQVLASVCLNGEPPQVIERAFEIVSYLPPRAIKQRLELLSQVDVRQIARDLKTPTLILQPTRDRLVGAVGYRELANALPAAMLQKIDAPHLLLQAKPSECWRHIREFIGQT